MAGLYAGQIQDVSNQTQQTIAASEDGINIFTLHGSKLLLTEQLGKAKDAIHGSAYFVRHVGYKLILEPIGLGQLLVQDGQLGQEILHVLLPIGKLPGGASHSVGHPLNLVGLPGRNRLVPKVLDSATQTLRDLYQFAEAAVNQKMS